MHSTLTPGARALARPVSSAYGWCACSTSAPSSDLLLDDGAPHVPLPWPLIGLRPMVCESDPNLGPKPATPAQRCVGFSIGVRSLAVK